MLLGASMPSGVPFGAASLHRFARPSHGNLNVLDSVADMAPIPPAFEAVSARTSDATIKPAAGTPIPVYADNTKINKG